MAEVLLKDSERIDELQRNGYRIIQDPNYFCFGMDAVLLTVFAKLKKGENVLDMGTGTGVIPILLAAKTQAGHFTGLEIQAACADMACRSVRMNDLEDRIDIVCGDIRKAAELFGRDAFDAVTCNPPYMTELHGIKNPEEPKAIARHEILCTLEDVVRNAASVLKVSGRLYMVHKPQRLSEIMVMMHDNGLEPKRLRMVHPEPDKAPSMILIEGVKGGRPHLTIEAPLVIYDSDRKYTKEVAEIYEPA